MHLYVLYFTKCKNYSSLRNQNENYKNYKVLSISEILSNVKKITYLKKLIALFFSYHCYSFIS